MPVIRFEAVTWFLGYGKPTRRTAASAAASRLRSRRHCLLAPESTAGRVLTPPGVVRAARMPRSRPVAAVCMSTDVGEPLE